MIALSYLMSTLVGVLLVQLSLMHPTMSFFVNKLSQFLHKLSKSYQTVAKKVLHHRKTLCLIVFSCVDKLHLILMLSLMKNQIGNHDDHTFNQPISLILKIILSHGSLESDDQQHACPNIEQLAPLLLKLIGFICFFKKWVSLGRNQQSSMTILGLCIFLKA